MFERQIDRRSFLGATAGLAALAVAPFARAMPTVDEIAFDPAIPALGNPEGDVTIAEFVDYQCPICKLVFVELKKLLVEDGGVRLVMKDWPIFGQESRYAARLALAAGPLYAQAVDALMSSDGALSSRRTEDILAGTGIDIGAVKSDLAARSADIEGVLSRNDAQAAAFKLRGTPALVVGGRLYRHGLPVAELKEAVRQARAL